MRICVIGLGEVGLPTALYIQKKRLDVLGYDINPVAVENARKRKLKATDDWHHVPAIDVYIICVSTGLRKGKPDMSAVYKTCGKIIEKKKPALVSIESTIVPGTSRKIYEELFKKRVHVVHAPHRYWASDPIKHGVKQLRVIGGADAKSLERGVRFYRDVLEIPVHIASLAEIAEFSKIAENAYRYVQIALAEEFCMMCEELGLDFDAVRRACNTKWNTNIQEARDGIKGHCLTKDTRYLADVTATHDLIESAMAVDKEYRERLQREKPEERGHE